MEGAKSVVFLLSSGSLCHTTVVQG